MSLGMSRLLLKLFVVYDQTGNVKSISGFELGPNGGERVFHLPLGANANTAEFAPAPNELRESTLLSLLNHPSVAEELSLTQDQQEMIAKVNEFWNSRTNALAKEMNLGFEGSNDTSHILDQIRSRRSKQDEELFKILVPHQVSRLKQVGFQSMVSIHGLLGVLSSPRFKKEFEFDAQQLTRLRERFSEIEDDLQTKIAKLKLEAKDSMIMELSPTQRSKLHELFGDTFQLHDEDWKKTK